MPLRELKVEYKAFEMKTALCHKFDVFLADETIFRLLPTFLGKAFYKRKIFPRSVTKFFLEFSGSLNHVFLQSPLFLFTLGIVRFS